MKHVIHHDLSEELARKTCKKAIESYAERFQDYEPASSWPHENRADISFNAKGVKLSGSIELSPGEIALALEVPFLFRPFQKRAVGIIEGQIRTWIKRQ